MLSAILVQLKTAPSGLSGAVDSDTGAYASVRRHSESVQMMTITMSSGSQAFTFGIRHIEHAPNPYKARGVNRQKEFVPEKFSFPVFASPERALRLNFHSQLGRLGVRLNTYTDSIERAGALCPCTGDLSQLSSA